MENDITADPITPVIRDQGIPRAAQPPPRRRGGMSAVLVLVVLLALGAAAWWLWQQQREQGVVREDALATRLDESVRSNAQMRRDLDSLSARLNDAEIVNRGVREELLSAGERARALEDALAHLADQRLTNRDALALNEAEFVLQLAGERLSLFHDASAAIAAYRLADSALAAAEDPLFASVRQTIGAEIKALEAAQPLQTQATLGALASLRGRMATLPVRSSSSAAPTESAQDSRLTRIFSQFVRISSDNGSATLASRDSGLARTLAVLDLRAAEAALFARDAAAFSASLASARGEIGVAFDGNAPAVADAVAELDRLGAMTMAPALPELGSALRELRNLRTTRALSRDVSAPLRDEASP